MEARRKFQALEIIGINMKRNYDEVRCVPIRVWISHIKQMSL